MISTYGPFGNRALVDMPTKVALELFAGDLAGAKPDETIDAALRDVERLRQRGPEGEELAETVPAALMVALAFEIAHPGNSATSKAANTAQIRECLEWLEARLPPKQSKDAVDEIGAKRDERRRAARKAGAKT